MSAKQSDFAMLHKRVKLLKPHRHAGRDYKPAQILELPEAKAAWLISVGSAMAEPALAPSPADAAQPPRVPTATPKAKE